MDTGMRIPAWLCALAAGVSPPGLAPAAADTGPVLRETRFMTGWDASRAVPATDIERPQSLDSFFFVTTWSGLQPGRSYRFSCSHVDGAGREVERTRVAHSAGAATWSFWCYRELDALDAPGTWKVTLVLEGQPPVVGEMPVSFTWRATLRRWLARLTQADDPPPAALTDTPQLLGTEMLTAWNPESRQPEHAVESIALPQPIYFYARWRNLEPRQTYAVQCAAADGAGVIRHRNSFAVRPTTSRWNVWCYFPLSARDPAGQWRFTMVLGEQLTAERQVLVEHGWMIRLLRSLGYPPPPPAKPRYRPDRRRL